MNTANKILENISLQIHYKAKDVLPNHIITYFHFDKNKYYGNVNDKGFTIWRSSFSLGIFYPVVSGTIQDEDLKKPLTLKSYMNSAGLTLAAIIFIGLFWGFPGLDLDNPTIPAVLLSFVFASLPMLAIYLAYSYPNVKC